MVHHTYHGYSLHKTANLSSRKFKEGLLCTPPWITSLLVKKKFPLIFVIEVLRKMISKSYTKGIIDMKNGNFNSMINILVRMWKLKRPSCKLIHLRAKYDNNSVFCTSSVFSILKKWGVSLLPFVSNFWKCGQNSYFCTLLKITPVSGFKELLFLPCSTYINPPAYGGVGAQGRPFSTGGAYGQYCWLGRVYKRKPKSNDDRQYVSIKTENFMLFKFKDGVFHYIRTQFPPPPSL